MLYCHRHSFIYYINTLMMIETTLCHRNPVFIFIVIIIIVVVVVVELTHSKTILENSLKTKPQPGALDFENLT